MEKKGSGEAERIKKEAPRIGEEIGRKAGLLKGEKKSIKKGRQVEKIKIKKQLKDNGVLIELIAKSTGLSEEEFKRL